MKVFLKLQSYRKNSAQARANHKLSARYYGLYKVLKRTGMVAYKPLLPPEAKIHHNFHVSQLKKKLGAKKVVQTCLPEVIEEGDANQKTDQRRQWKEGTPETATWELREDMTGKSQDEVIVTNRKI